MMRQRCRFPWRNDICTSTPGTVSIVYNSVEIPFSGRKIFWGSSLTMLILSISMNT